jgi:hypothetical protein
MDAIRCTECGEVRWSIFSIGSKAMDPCEVCGGETAPERRQPDRGRITAAAERRDCAPAAAPQA